ncbi:MAG: HD domain-containing protein [Brevinematales bacterium]|nr:HD domain-containing protein [Brevinematales bacterium]
MSITEEIKNNPLEMPMFISKTLADNGYECYVVGGIVRDFILYKSIPEDADWDFATSAEPDEVTRIFQRKKLLVIPTGIKHGTVTVFHNGKNYQITTFRIDKNYYDYRHPSEVVFTRNIREDLARRDFTINAMALDLIKGEIIDEFGGMEDLKNGIIRAVGDPEVRFEEDALRMLRACRFASKLNFRIEEKTLLAIKNKAENITKISAERVRDEIIKIMLSYKPSIGIEYMRETGLLSYILPELQDCYGVSQNVYHKYDVYYHSLLTCDKISDFIEGVNDQKRIYRLKLAGLFHDIAKPVTKQEVIENGIDVSTFYNHEVVGAGMTKRILKRLRFSNDDIDYITRLVRHHMFYYTDEWTDSAVRRFMRNVGLDLLDDLFILREADRIGSGKRKPGSVSLQKLKDRILMIIEQENAISLKDLKVDGYDIMSALNIPPGPMVGRILNGLLQIVIEDPSKNEKETLIKLAADLYRNFQQTTKT